RTEVHGGRPLLVPADRAQPERRGWRFLLAVGPPAALVRGFRGRRRGRVRLGPAARPLAGTRARPSAARPGRAAARRPARATGATGAARTAGATGAAGAGRAGRGT